MINEAAAQAMAEVCRLTPEVGAHSTAAGLSLFSELAHVHGLTKTVRPLLEVTAFLAPVCVSGRRAPDSALEEAVNQGLTASSAEHRRMVLEALVLARKSPSRQCCARVHDSRDDIVRRLSALAQIAAALNRSQSCEARVVGIFDDGNTLEVWVEGGHELPGDIVAASESAALWNATLARPISGIRVHDGRRRAGPLFESATPVTEAARRSIQCSMEAFCARLYGVDRSEDIEYVHEMRVALRRLRAAMRMFKGSLGEEILDRRLELKQISDALGMVRNLDVFMEFLSGYAPKAFLSHKPFLEKLIRNEQRVRRRSYGELVRYFQTQPFLEFKESFTAQLREPLAVPDSPGLDPTAEVRAVAPKLIRQQLKRILRYESPLEQYLIEELHRLRLECKKARYTMEFFSSIYPRKLRKVIKAVSRMQEELGHVHDAEVYMDRVQGYYDHCRKNGHEREHLEACETLLGHLRKWRSASLRQAECTWKGFTRKKIVKQAREIVASPKHG